MAVPIEVYIWSLKYLARIYGQYSQLTLYSSVPSLKSASWIRSGMPSIVRHHSGDGIKVSRRTQRIQAHENGVLLVYRKSVVLIVIYYVDLSLRVVGDHHTCLQRVEYLETNSVEGGSQSTCALLLAFPFF